MNMQATKTKKYIANHEGREEIYFQGQESIVPYSTKKGFWSLEETKRVFSSIEERESCYV